MKNIKNILSVSVFSLMFILGTQFVWAQQQGVHEPGTGIENPELKRAGQGGGEAVPALYNEQDRNNQNEKNNQAQIKSKGLGQAGAKNIPRRSRVANAVQEMLMLAEKNQGIGKQIRTIARNQQENIDSLEEKLKQIKNRGRLKKFFLGPDYKNLNSVEGMIVNHEERLSELKNLALQISDDEDLQKLQEQIMVMENISKELKQETLGERDGFSLFGWLYKKFAK